ncbi:MAG: DUF4864 domain-containing protein [Pseudomonadota bacterium]
MPRFSRHALMLAAALTISAPMALADAEADSRAVIEQQLDAFQRDDWREAFSYASPGIQALFQNPQRFSEMVIGGYPMVWRPADVSFLGADLENGDLVHRLQLVDQEGVAYVARYTMTEIDGVWRIAGVVIERAAEA